MHTLCVKIAATLSKPFVYEIPEAIWNRSKDDFIAHGQTTRSSTYSGDGELVVHALGNGYVSFMWHANGNRVPFPPEAMQGLRYRGEWTISPY